MNIAVLSGKGGTGKTLLAVNLAAAAGECVYLDCDVEEPNGHLFFKPSEVQTEKITVKIPAVDEGLCTGCRKCVEFCKFNALALIKNRPFVFDEVCHSCGGCVLLCPEKALHETEKEIGRIRQGLSEGVTVFSGVLNIGETSGVPIIKKLLERERALNAQTVFIDCPPGSACSVMESIKDADFCILVAEPTLFGVQNLGMVHELVQLFQKPCGAVLNKCLEGENPAEAFCLEKGIEILGKIPFDQNLGALNSEARIAARDAPEYRALFSGLLRAVREEAGHETAVDPER